MTEPARARSRVGVAGGDRRPLVAAAALARARDGRPVHLRRRADLHGARAEPGRHGQLCRPGDRRQRLQHPLPGASGARVRRVRQPRRRVRRGEGDERRRDVARRDSDLPAGAPRRGRAPRAARRRDRRRRPVDGLHRDDHDGEPLLPGRARPRVRPRPLPRTTRVAVARRARRRARDRVRDAVAVARLRAGDRDGAAPPGAAPVALVGTPPVRAALRARRGRRDRARRAPGRARPLARPTCSAPTASWARAGTTPARCCGSGCGTSRSSTSTSGSCPSRRCCSRCSSAAPFPTGSRSTSRRRRRSSSGRRSRSAPSRRGSRRTASRTGTCSSSRRSSSSSCSPGSSSALHGLACPTIAAAAIALALVLVFPYVRFIGEPAKSDTLGLVPLWTINEHLVAGSYWATVALAGVALLALYLLVPARYAVAVPLVLLVLFAVLSRPVWSGPHGFVAAGIGALRQGNPGLPRDWIDRAVPAGGRGRGALDRSRRPVHGQHERVLQPARRAGLLHRPADARRLRRDPRDATRRPARARASSSSRTARWSRCRTRSSTAP